VVLGTYVVCTACFAEFRDDDETISRGGVRAAFPPLVLGNPLLQDGALPAVADPRLDYMALSSSFRAILRVSTGTNCWIRAFESRP
jgi:hypothetical protein